MESAIQDLVKMRDIESLYEVMTEDDDWMLCLDAAEGLVTLGDERGIEFLQDAIESDDEEISAVAKEILDSPEVRRLRDEIASRQRQERQSAFETAKKRLQQGKKVFRYKTVYLPASYFAGETVDEQGENIPALDDFGLQGWEVAAFFSLSDTVPAITMGGKLTGGYFLLQKEIAPDEAAELDEL
jgi:hypothetical protein